MRRFGIGVFYPFHLEVFDGFPLAAQLLFKPTDGFHMIHQHLVHLLHLALQESNVGSDFFQSVLEFSVHKSKTANEPPPRQSVHG